MLQKFLALTHMLGFKAGMSHPIFIEAFQDGDTDSPRPQMLRAMILAACIEKQDAKISQFALAYANFVKAKNLNGQKF